MLENPQFCGQKIMAQLKNGVFSRSRQEKKIETWPIAEIVNSSKECQKNDCWSIWLLQSAAQYWGWGKSGNFEISVHSSHVQIPKIEQMTLSVTCVLKELESGLEEPFSNRKLPTHQFLRNCRWVENAQFLKFSQSDIWNATSTQKWSIWYIPPEIDSPSISITQTYIVPKSFGAFFGPKNTFYTDNSIPRSN